MINSGTLFLCGKLSVLVLSFYSGWQLPEMYMKLATM